MASSPPRLWRLTPAQYDNTVTALGISKAAYINPFQGVASGERFRNYSGSFGFPSVTADLAFSAAQEAGGAIADKLVAATPCLKAPDQACWRAAITSVGQRLFRRPLTADEVTRYIMFASSLQADLGAPTALAGLLQAILSSPHFLFRIERGEGAPDAAGRRKLGPYEVASALSYTLTDGPPDAMLLADAAAGALATPAQIKAHATRLLGAVPDNKPLARFAREYFLFDRAPDIFKDQKLYPFHAPLDLVDDTARFVRELLAGGGDFFSGVLTASWGFARKTTTQSYNLTGTPGDQPARVELPAGQRSGILTQPSFLVSFSATDDTNPVSRGKFIAQSLLCKALPDTPPGEVPPLPKTADQTMREKLMVHRMAAPTCRSCHDLMDPLGLGLEGFDHVGRFRTTDHGKPADASGELTGSGNGDGPFKDAADLSRRLAASPVSRQCFVRYNLRYWLGRPELDSDGCALTAAFDASKGGADMAALVVSLLTSDSFLYRSAGAP
jgi:hypothetical protein